jgi:hypothetical protein
MIQHIDDHVPPFDDPAQEREWLAQESAMRRERLHLDPAGDDARSRRYRLVARALSEPLPQDLPADFAACVAARAAAPPMPSPRFESVLTSVLLGTLAIAAGVVTLIYGSAWLPWFDTVLPTLHTQANCWLLALAGCLGASWLLGQWSPHGHDRPAADAR